MEGKYILTLDVGTTTIRSFIYNSNSEIIGKAINQVILHYPSPGFVEIDPDELWPAIVDVVQKSFLDGKISPGQVMAMGISTQRSTFITWSRQTGRPFHNLITWKDLRADELVKQWNTSYLWRFIRGGSYALHLILRSKRYLAGSVLKFMNTQTTLRLLWALKNITSLQEAVKKNDALFGTLDTWLLYKLTGGKLHVTDVSSASATGLFDPFMMAWASWAMSVFQLPQNIFPQVVDTAGKHFTNTAPEIWGNSIPILCCMGDQTASMWGSCCFDEGEVKLTMGTGTFININTGISPHASVSGLYPIVGWRIGKELVYLAEGANNDTASIILWAKSLGLFEKPEDTADIAVSVPDSDGVYFIPAFSGIGPPFNDTLAASGFVGVKASTTKAHLVRAILESLAFCTAQLYTCVRKETTIPFHTIRLDGGVSNNDFIAQTIADLTGLRVERPTNTEMSSLGCLYIVGLQMGIWKSKEELRSIYKLGKVFDPHPQMKEIYEYRMKKWVDAVKRMCGWYSDDLVSSRLSISSSTSGYVTAKDKSKEKVKEKKTN